ncbi:MAG: LamG domain-containing protein, partial [Deltaproteobacteria bacterium]|nr:LamG domain-containing protein [Deltaproteobacteria bacterium]
IACGYSPNDAPLAYAYNTAPQCFAESANAPTTCFTDTAHGTFTTYATGLLTDTRRGGPLSSGGWAGFKGVTPVVTLRSPASRPLTTLTLGIGTATSGSVVAAQPSRVDVSFSDNGTTFADTRTFTLAAHTLPAIAPGGRGDVILDLGGLTARYVRVTFSGNPSNKWTFLDEVSLGAACSIGTCNPATSSCSNAPALDGTPCGGPGDTCKSGVCSDCSARGLLDCGGTCVASADATSACLTPASGPCASIADCAQFAWLDTACVAGSCSYAPKLCDGPDFDGCMDGRLRPDGTCQDTGPTLLWDFDEGQTVTAIDDSGSGNYGLWNGTVAFDNAGRFGKALTLSAANHAYVSRAQTLAATDFTEAAWFKTTSPTGGLFGGALPGPAALDREVFVSSGRLSYKVAFASYEPACSSASRVDDGAWHHAALTCQPKVGCALYLDGARVCASSAWNDTSSLAAASLDGQAFVAGWTGMGGFLDGALDQVALFDHALSAAEVLALQSGILTPAQGNNRPRCDGLDHACAGATVLNTTCEDGDPCTVGDRCAQDGSCTAGTPVTCADPGACKTAACSPAAGGCVISNQPDGTSCDDGDPLTATDQCHFGTCQGTPKCKTLTCTSTSCALADQPDGTACDDGDPSTSNDQCASGLCHGALPPGSQLSAPAFLAPTNFAARLTAGPSSFPPPCTLGVNCDSIEYVDPLTNVRWMIVTDLDKNDIGFTGWRAADDGHGGTVPNRYLTSGFGYFYTSPALSLPFAHLDANVDVYLPVPLTNFGVTTGSPLSAGGRLTIPFPAERLTNGWRFDAPSIGAGIAPGRELKWLNAPLNEDRAYVFGGLLAGINIALPGQLEPVPIGYQASLAVDPSDPMFFLRIPNVSSDAPTWLTGSIGFSKHGLLQHRAGMKLWNGIPAPENTFLSDAGNAGLLQVIVNPAHVYLEIEKVLRIPGIEFLTMDDEGKISFHFGNVDNTHDWAPDWSRWAGSDPINFVPAQEKWSMLFEGKTTLKLKIPIKIKSKDTSLPITMQLGREALYAEVDPQAHTSMMTARGTTAGQLPIEKLIPGLEFAHFLGGGSSEVQIFLNNRDTTCGSSLVSCTNNSACYSGETCLAGKCSRPCTAADTEFGMRIEQQSPFSRSVFQFVSGASPSDPLDITLDGEFSLGVINIAPGVGFDLGTFGTSMTYDGEKFCMGRFVDAGTHKIDRNGVSQDTTCQVRLCMGKQGDFYAGTEVHCQPFCIHDGECNSGQVCNYGFCEAPNINGAACQKDSACQSDHCFLGICKECAPGSTGQCGSDKYCDDIGSCMPRIPRDSALTCYSGKEFRDDWCVDGSICDQTAAASGYCHECTSPKTMPNGDPVAGYGCKGDGQFCDGDGHCQNPRGFGSSCYVPALAEGLDSWCKAPIGRDSGSCGDPAWTCRECGYDTKSTTNPDPACGAGNYCDLGSYTCHAKLKLGDACGAVGGGSDFKCASGACDAYCFSYHSAGVGESCRVNGWNIQGMCKSGQCLANGVCGCGGSDSNCSTNQFCDPILGTCTNKLAVGASCSLVGGDHACQSIVDSHGNVTNAGKCSVGGDALPGVCYEQATQKYGASCHANGECTSNNCRAGAGDTCGCGGKASECGSGQFCGGAFGDTCMNKLPAGAICQQDGRQCTSGTCNYSSPGVYTCGCTGDEQCPGGQYCDVSSGSYTGANVCRVRIPAGSQCHRTGECWLRPAAGYTPAECKSGPTYSCNPYGCKVKAPCFPDFWNTCSYDSTCYKQCVPAPVCQGI